MPFTHATSTNNYGPSHIIVSSSVSNGTHTSITSALADAVSGDTIFIRNGTYVEDPVLVAGVTLAAYSGNGFTPNVIIQGNITASYTGSVTISGIRIRTNGAACLTVSGTNVGVLNLLNCLVSAVDATAMSINNANYAINVISCICNAASTNLLFAITSVGGLGFRYCELSGNTSANTIASGSVNIFNCTCGTFSISTSSTGTIVCYNTFIDNSAANQTIFTFSGTGNGHIQTSSLYSGSASTISIGAGCVANVSTCSVSSSNANVITGAGTINVGGLSWTGSSSVISSTTKTVFTQDITSTFTPTLTFGGASTGITYNLQEAQYTKIGNILFFAIIISLSNKGSATGTAAIAGLPFQVGGMSSQIGFAQVDNVTFSATFNAPFLRQITSSSTIQLWQTGSGVVGIALTDTNFSNTSNVRAQGFYYV